MPTTYKISPARPADLPLLPAIELAAAQLLAGHAPESVLAETTSLDVLRRAQSRGQLWVALAEDIPVGYARVEILEPGAAHLEEIDVHPDHGRRGLGTRLVDAVCEWAAGEGYSSVTLSTFREVRWNMPFYAGRGFDVIPDESLTPALRAVVDDEQRRGMDPGRRVVMRRAVSRDTAVKRGTEITLVSESDRPQLMDVWEASVRATHHFLNEADLDRIKRLTREELPRLAPIHCLRDADGLVYAFMFVADGKIEALFIAPAHQGAGAGRRLVEYAITELGADAVDVNQQNDLAVGFYERMGFRAFARDALDANGLPFPILHMKLSSPHLDRGRPPE